MNVEDLRQLVVRSFGFPPTADQQYAIETFCRFLFSREDRPVMVLSGSAGTGKTALSAAFVRTLVSLHQRVVLLAPTGRAAKVLTLNAGIPAFTIHRRIYRQKTFTGEMTGFSLNFNRQRDTLFLVDEASMVSNDSFQQGGVSAFGSGCLLDDLMQFVFSAPNCRLLIVGDKAQLPPVGEEESPALMTDFLQNRYLLDMHSANLDTVLRQAAESGILFNADMIRRMITHDELTQLPKIHFKGFADICVVPGDELIEQLAGSYSQVGMDEVTVVTRSNKRANIYNNGIRRMVLGCEDELTPGDMLMMVRNNYYWIAAEKAAAKTDAPSAPMPPNETAEDSGLSEMAFIANGDRAVVRRVRNMQELYGLRFADLLLEFPDYNNYELHATVVLDSLLSESPSLTREQSEKLFEGVLADYSDIQLKADRMKHVRNDKYYNALQVKFAYAATCHKAQGGQWAHVYVDQGYMTDDMLTPDYIHWLYTAFTRATEKLFLVNWPKTQQADEGDE